MVTWNDLQTADFWERWFTYWPSAKNEDRAKLMSAWGKYLAKVTPQVAIKALEEIWETQGARRQPTNKQFREAAEKLSAETRRRGGAYCEVCYGVESVPVALWTLPVGDVALIEAGPEVAKEFTYWRVLNGQRMKITRMALELKAAKTMQATSIVFGTVYCPGCAKQGIPKELQAPAFDRAYRGKYAIAPNYEHLTADLGRMVRGERSERGPDITPQEIAADDEFWDAMFERPMDEKTFRALKRLRAKTAMGYMPHELWDRRFEKGK